MRSFYRVASVLRMLPLFIGRELREQYAGSFLGVLWGILQPALYILLYWWVFAVVMRARLPTDSGLADTPFIIFLLSALLPWFAFQDGLNRAANAIIGHRDMVCKVHFPVIVFPLSAVAAACLMYASSYFLLLVVLSVLKGSLSINVVGAALVLWSVQLMMTAGFGLLLAALTVYLRDATQILGLLLSVMFYTTPILYPLNLAPAEFQIFLWFNPFTSFTEGYHRVFLMGIWPDPALLLGSTLLAFGALAIGTYIFQRLEPGFPDVL